MSRKRKQPAARGLLMVPVLFFALSFLLLAVRKGDWRLYTLAAAWPAFCLISGLLFPVLVGMDRILLTLTHFISGILLLLTALWIPDRLLFMLIQLAAGCFLMLFSLALSSSSGGKTAFSAGMGVLALVALLLPFVFALPVDTGYSACVFLLFPLCLLGRNRQAGLGLLLYLAGLAPLLISGNWASAAGWTLTGSFLLWIASGSWLTGILSFLSGAAGWIAGALFLPSMALQQLPRLSVSELAAAFSGGLFGSGPGLGSALPAADPPVIWPLIVLSEQFGILFLIGLILLYAFLLIRSASGALLARRELPALQTAGLILLPGIRAVLSLCALSGLIPVPASGFPLLSPDPLVYVTDLFAVGWIAGQLTSNNRDLDEDEHLAMLAH
ncbi:MAG: hypothetical protein J6U01_06520 [Clostridia bacterium]|nr:hypothetical protein [Clostridia bacterium]